MKKQDLEAGMLVELRDGRKFILIPNKDGLQGGLVGEENTLRNIWVTISDYSEDMCMEHQYDIMKVWGLSDRSPLAPKEKRKLLWERKPKIELTIDERTILTLLIKLGYTDVTNYGRGCVGASHLGGKSVYVETSLFDILEKDPITYSIKELLKGE